MPLHKGFHSFGTIIAKSTGVVTKSIDFLGETEHVEKNNVIVGIKFVFRSGSADACDRDNRECSRDKGGGGYALLLQQAFA